MTKITCSHSHLQSGFNGCVMRFRCCPLICDLLLRFAFITLCCSAHSAQVAVVFPKNIAMGAPWFTCSRNLMHSSSGGGGSASPQGATCTTSARLSWPPCSSPVQGPSTTSWTMNQHPGLPKHRHMWGYTLPRVMLCSEAQTKVSTVSTVCVRDRERGHHLPAFPIHLSDHIYFSCCLDQSPVQYAHN